MSSEPRTFLPKGEFVVRKSFRIAGRTYEPGDIFQWRKVAGLAQRKVWQLWLQLYVDCRLPGEVEEVLDLHNEEVDAAVEEDLFVPVEEEE